MLNPQLRNFKLSRLFLLPLAMLNRQLRNFKPSRSNISNNSSSSKANYLKCRSMRPHPDHMRRALSSSNPFIWPPSPSRSSWLRGSHRRSMPPLGSPFTQHRPASVRRPNTRRFRSSGHRRRSEGRRPPTDGRTKIIL
jgi:hypothetical protein